MTPGEILNRYPATVTFANDGHTPASFYTGLHRMFATDVVVGSGNRRNYTDLDIRQWAAYHVVRRALVRLGLPERSVGSRQPRFFAALRTQVAERMPARLVVSAADVELIVNVPFVVQAEMNAALVERVA